MSDPDIPQATASTMTQVGQAGAALVRCLRGDPRVQRANETWRAAHGLLPGATVTAETLQSVERGRVFFFGCLAHAKRGSSVCDNALVLPIDRVDDAVLSKLSRDVLHQPSSRRFSMACSRRCNRRRSPGMSGRCGSNCGRSTPRSRTCHGHRERRSGSHRPTGD